MKTLIRTNNPFFNSFPSIMDDLLGKETPTRKSSYRSLTQPKVNITEDKDNFVLDFYVPGVKKEDFKIEIENETLSVSYEEKSDENKDDKKMTRKEFDMGTFKRSFTLSKEIDKKTIKAKHENGVLSITLQKAKVTKPALATIEIE